MVRYFSFIITIGDEWSPIQSLIITYLDIHCMYTSQPTTLNMEHGKRKDKLQAKSV